MDDSEVSGFDDSGVVLDTDLLALARGSVWKKATGARFVRTDASGVIQLGGRSVGALSVFGYSSTYKVLLLGNAATSSASAVSISLNCDISANPSSTFDGDGREIIVRNGSVLISPNAANNAFHRYFSFSGGSVLAGADGSTNLGSASYRFGTVYATTGSINTSDERAKQDIGELPDEWLDAWGAVEWRRYRFIDAVAEKGDDARWHIGLIAQAVKQAFDDAGLDALAIGLLCYDSWPAETRPLMEPHTGTRPVEKQVAVEAGELDGQPVFRFETRTVDEPFEEMVDTGELEEVRPAGDRWGLRYDECFAIEAAYQRRRMERIEARVAEIGQNG